MSNTLIAFVESDQSTNHVLEYALSNGIRRVLFISENELTGKTLDSVVVGYANISDYQPIDLDQKVLVEIDRRYELWLQSNNRLKDILEETCIGKVVRMSFDAIIFQLLRRVVLTGIIINKYQPDKVIADQYWTTFIAFECYEHIQFQKIGAPLYRHTDSVKSDFKNLFYNLKYAFITFLGGMLFPVIIGKLVNFIVGTSPHKSELLLIGATQSSKSFMPVWKKISKEFTSYSELKYATMNLKSIRDDINKKIPWIDGLACFWEFPRLSFDFFRLTLCFFNSKKNFPVQNSTGTGSAVVDFASDFSINIDYFFLRTFAKALLFVRLACYFTKETKLQAVVFTTLTPASRALSLALQSKGIKTITTTHGMVLEPIAYRSEDSIKLTWSAFDARLLASYSLDKQYQGLPANPEGFKKTAGEPLSWTIVKVYPACIKFLKSINSTHSCYRNLGKIVIIFPSTNQHGQSLRRFLNICLSHLFANRDKYQFDSVIIKPKNHPRTKIEEFDKILAEIIPAKLKTPVVLTCDIDINTVLKKSTFALCAHSSIMLDCIRLAVPFSVYNYGTLSSKAFLERLPEWMRFSNEKQLEEISKEDLLKFQCTAKNLAETYWGNVEENISSLNDLIFSIKSKGL